MDNINAKKAYVRRLVCDSLRTAEVVRGVLVLAAVSGGRDSVVLLHCLKELKEEFGYRLEAVHVNHGMRETARRDETFVKQLCAEWDVPCHVCTADVPKRIRETKESPEEAARKVRYEAIREICSRTGADLIAVAHHADDQAETMLLGISRGSSGMLHGMRQDMTDTRGRIIRPMLGATGDEIGEYAVAAGLSWMEDETNSDPSVTRNRIRRKVIPYLKEELDPNLVTHLSTLSQRLQEDDDVLCMIADERAKELVTEKNVGLHVKEAVMHEAPAVRRRIIDEALGRAAVKRSAATREGLETLFLKQSGRRITLGADMEAVRDREGILIRRVTARLSDVITLNVPGKTVTPWGVFEASQIRICADPVTEGNCQWVPAGCTRLAVRCSRAGEKISPIGLNGMKLVSDVFSDKGILLAEREVYPIVADEEGPVWIPGICADRKFTLQKGMPAYLIVFKRKES